MDQNKVIGMIGGGNMGGGIVAGIISAGLLPARNIIISDVNEAALSKLRNKYGVRTTGSNADLCAEADVIFLAVKPFLLANVILEIRDYVNADALVISVAAGQSIERIEGLFGRELRLIRMMPNLGALVGESMTGYTANEFADEDDKELAAELLSSFGKCEEIAENLMDVVTGVSGSAPAYISMMIEAMADAAVLNGMPRAKAYTFCEQAMLGTAKYLLETGLSPSALKDMVCTPGGTSIAAIAEMERCGLRNAVISGVNSCVDKSKKL